MTTSAKLGLELLQNNAANQTLANTTFAIIDQLCQAGVVDKDLATPPGSPANGALYIVASSPTGAWAGKAGQLAFWLTTVGAWTFIVPREGFLVHVNDEDAFYKYNGSAWAKEGSASNEIAIQDEGIAVGNFETINFTGTGVTVSADTGGRVTVNIPGAGSASSPEVVTDSTTARILSTSDAGKYLRFTNGSSSTVTVNPQSSVTWDANAEVHIRRAAAGNLTITPGSGVTLNAPSGGTLVMTNNMTVTLKRAAENVWDVIGQTVPA